MGWGDLLREARERRGLSLDDVEQAIKIRQKYLVALEAEDARMLPGPIYARGFLRNYATYLGLDPDEVLALYPYQPEPVPVPPPMTLGRPSSGSFLTWFPVVVLILLLALLGAYLYGGEQSTGATPNEPIGTATLQVPAVVPTLVPLPTSTPTASPTPVPSPTPTPPRVEVAVKAVAASWVVVTVDDREAFTGTLKVGDSHTWAGRERISLRADNAGGLEITFNGKSLGPLGEPGQVVTAEWGPAGGTILTPIPTATRPPRPPTATPTPTPSAMPTAVPTVAPTAVPTAAPAPPEEPAGAAEPEPAPPEE